jgi:hypothetical protein
LALTKVQVVSAALLQLGHAPVISLTEGDPLVTAAEMAFDLLLPAVLSQGNWRFCTQISQLSLTTETAPYPWTSVYLLPAGFLKMLRIYPNIYLWDLYLDQKIYTQFDNELFMEYVFQPNVSQLPPHFTQYFVYEIAAYLALSNAQSAPFFSVLEGKRVQMQAMAHAIETQNRPQFSQVSFPVLNNRFIGGMIGNSFNL